MKPEESLKIALAEAISSLQNSFLNEKAAIESVESVCRCNTNKAPIRFLMACLLAKIDRPEVDIRKPYTEIKGGGTFSGRAYDEGFVETFVRQNRLPCNSSTAFLTPAFRNIDRILTTDLVLVGKPREVYEATLVLLDFVHRQKCSPENLLREIVRNLLIIKQEDENRMRQLLSNLRRATDSPDLSSEQIVSLLQQHLNCKNSSRLPVLIVAAAYLSVQEKTGERPLPLNRHNAADKQTGSIGDIEIALLNDGQVLTCYEMKDKKVTLNDINHALQKIHASGEAIGNYIFITTDAVEPEVLEYAKSIYDQAGVEIAILDCLSFARHFLHFFHRYRTDFLDKYQNLVLEEPESAIGQPLKEAFLILRKQAESN